MENGWPIGRAGQTTHTMDSIREDPYNIRFVNQSEITEEMCYEAIRKEPFTYWYVPIRMRTSEMLTEARRVYKGTRDDFLPDIYTPAARIIAQPVNETFRPFGKIT